MRSEVSGVLVTVRRVLARIPLAFSPRPPFHASLRLGGFLLSQARYTLFGYGYRQVTLSRVEEVSFSFNMVS